MTAPDSATTTTVVVVAYGMARELPRTLRSLSPGHQRGVDPERYEVVVVDNGSPEPVDAAVLRGAFGSAGHLRVERLDPAPPSPARAANLGIGLATGELVGLVVDGARLASPGLVATASLAARLAERPVITAGAWHLGAVPQGQATAAGHDQVSEDALLAGSGWEADGYRLFAVSCLAGSSGRGIFGPMGESSSLFLPRSLWRELGGLDERFSLPGGGLVNHDLYRRACGLPGAQLVVMLGEGTFHQFHGGAATSGRYGWDEMHAEYEAITGAPHRPPDVDALYVGRLTPEAMVHVERSAQLARARRARLAARAPAAGEPAAGAGR